ncbi:MAG: helix-turn-helix transcriptional regulator [Nocardioidaceae bacterium]
MALRKSERLLNLLIALLVARSYVSKERLREAVEQYRDAGDDAFEKMFERDKDDLRALGVPIEVGYLDKAFEDEPGYRIVRSAFELPEIALEPEEAAIIGLAARVWQHAGLASATSDALVKLKAAGVSVDREALNIVQPRLAADEPAFEAFWSAISSRRAVTFEYRRSSAPTASTRHLEPWSMVSSRGRWYVVGNDTDRDDVRMFRLSRVQGPVTLARAAGTFTVPEGVDLRALTESLEPASDEGTATVLVREGAAHGLRRHADPSDEGGPVPSGWQRMVARYRSGSAFTDEVLGYAADVVVETPQEIRASVVRRLEGAAT